MTEVNAGANQYRAGLAAGWAKGHTRPMEKPDVIVIGAGVIGAATTFELAKRGRSVLSLDAGNGVGAGSTSSSSAIIRFHYSTLASVATSWEAAAMWRDLAAHLGHRDPNGMVRFISCGALVLDYPGHNRTTVLEHFDHLGVPYEELTAAQIGERFPALDTGDYSPARPIDDPSFADAADTELGAYFTPDAGFIDDPMLAAQNFMHAAQQLGASVRLHARVTDIRIEGGAVRGVTLASGERIDAPVVINVAGPASSRVNAMAGVINDMTIRHRPLRQEVFVSEAPTGFGLGPGALVTDIGLGVYFRPHLGGTLLIGGTEPECDVLEWIDDPDHYRDQPTQEGFERALYRTARRVPDLGIPHRRTGLAALYDASDDWVPIYDKSSVDGFFMACGTSGNQFKNAPMSGVFMSELVEAAERGQDHDTDPVVVTGPRTGVEIDLSAFSRNREPATTSGTVMG